MKGHSKLFDAAGGMLVLIVEALTLRSDRFAVNLRHQNSRIMLNHNGTDNHDRSPVQTRQCAMCGSDYAITAAEQAFRGEHRLGTPALCPECRAVQRAGRNAEIIAIYEKATNGNSPDVSPAARNGKSNVRGQLYTTVCDACGSETRVPFIPRGDRPVYCKDCFNARRGR